MGETHGKERLKTISLPDIALLIGTGRRRVILEEVGLCRGWKGNVRCPASGEAGQQTGDRCQVSGVGCWLLVGGCWLLVVGINLK